MFFLVFFQIHETVSGPWNITVHYVNSTQKDENYYADIGKSDGDLLHVSTGNREKIYLDFQEDSLTVSTDTEELTFYDSPHTNESTIVFHSPEQIEYTRYDGLSLTVFYFQKIKPASVQIPLSSILAVLGVLVFIKNH